jgi:hypothetical protein
LNGALSEVDWQVFGVILVALFWFGVAYNAWVGDLRERKEGYTALLVVVGVIVTLLGAALINWQAALIVFACFAASGLPMVLGDIQRTIKLREDAIQRIRRETGGDDEA